MSSPQLLELLYTTLAPNNFPVHLFGQFQLDLYRSAFCPTELEWYSTPVVFTRGPAGLPKLASYNPAIDCVTSSTFWLYYHTKLVIDGKHEKNHLLKYLL